MLRRLVVGLVASGCLLAAPMAGAAQVTWKSGSLGAGSRDASGTYPQLRASAAGADSSAHKIRAGAHLPGGWTLYASFAEAWGSVCHSYSGAMDLGALIENPHTVSQNPVTGILRYYSWETPC